MGGAEFDAPPLTLLVLDEVGGVAALAAVTAGSDFRPSEYPSAKNNAHTPTRPKNSTSSFPVPSVISVSSDEAITHPPCSDRRFRQLPERKSNARISANPGRYAQLLTAKLCRLSWRRLIISRLPKNFLNPREEIHRHRKHDGRILLDSDLGQGL